MKTKWITLRTAGEKYQIKEEIIYLWVKLGKFNETRKVGGRLFLNQDKLDEYVRWRKTEMAPADYVDELELKCYDLTTKLDLCMLSVKMLKRENEGLKAKNQLLEQFKESKDMEIENFVETQKAIREKMNLNAFK